MTKTNKQAPLQWLYMTATLMIIIGALPLTTILAILKIVYALGVLGYAFYYFIGQSGAETSLLERRIIRLNRYASLLLGISAVARFGLLDRYGQNLWIFFLFLALIFIVYTNHLLLKKS